MLSVQRRYFSVNYPKWSIFFFTADALIDISMIYVDSKDENMERYSFIHSVGLYYGPFLIVPMNFNEFELYLHRLGFIQNALVCEIEHFWYHSFKERQILYLPNIHSIRFAVHKMQWWWWWWWRIKLYIDHPYEKWFVKKNGITKMLFEWRRSSNGTVTSIINQ